MALCLQNKIYLTHSWIVSTNTIVLDCVLNVKEQQLEFLSIIFKTSEDFEFFF